MPCFSKSLIPEIYLAAKNVKNTHNAGEGEGEVAFFSAKRWDRRNRANLIESAIPCHDAHVVGSYRDPNPLRLTVMAGMSEDYTTAPQHLQHLASILETEQHLMLFHRPSTILSNCIGLLNLGIVFFFKSFINMERI